MRSRVAAVLALALIASRSDAFAQNVDAGRKAFESRCARCHGADGNGGEMGPPIAQRLPPLDDQQLSKLVHEGIPAKGMPPSVIDDPGSRRSRPLPAHDSNGAPTTIPLFADASRSPTAGPLEGQIVGEGFDDVQLRTDDERVHLLRRAGERVPRGDFGSRLAQLQRRPRRQPLHDADPDHKTNVGAAGAEVGVLRSRTPARLQVTPVVVDGIMYVTGAKRMLRARCRHRPPDLALPAAADARASTAGGANRGVGGRRRSRLHGDRQRAHHRAQPLHRRAAVGHRDGRLAQELLRHVGAAGRRQPGHRRVSAAASTARAASSPRYDQETGKEVWRFWTVPKPGEPGSETWQGKDIEHGGAPTWFTGSYDPAARHRLLADRQSEQGVQRRRSRRATTSTPTASWRSIAKTGKLKWHYQFTPHDLWDWDATETPVLVDAAWEGQPRKLMLHANRNGFFYVFDRTDGKLLLAKPFVKNLTWASGIGADGRPIKLPNQEPSAGRHARSARRRTARPTGSRRRYNPATGLYYVQTFEKCSIYTKTRSGRVGEPARRISAARSARRAGSEAAAHPEGDRHPHRQDRVGAAAARPGAIVGRHAGAPPPAS